jgi:hypothetical protein
MSVLPQYLRRAPFIIYAVGALVFVWNLANQWLLLNANPYADVTMDSLETLQKSSALYDATVELIYIVVNGALLQVLIAIYDKMKGPQA